MSTVRSPVSDMLVTVKSREVQRGMMAAMGGQSSDAKRHFLAAAHLELVLAGDYDGAGESNLSRRSRISAASCFWRAGEIISAQAMFNELLREDPNRAGEIQEVVDELKSA